LLVSGCWWTFGGGWALLLAGGLLMALGVASYRRGISTPRRDE
jgi:hypothetical protein